MKSHLLAKCQYASFECERSHRNLPALTWRTHAEVGRGACPVKENLVELGCSSDLADGAYLDTRLIHWYEQVRQALMALGAFFGPADHKAPVRPLG
ncbi:unannotated protein [freshwater metagenome]|uniref:Unannotated protein n=1 Tax=freshwater metagenome TaxID=449393 RepID=A0A6J6TQQ3_9ZZZZ